MSGPEKKENRRYVDGMLVCESSSNGYPTIWFKNKNYLVHRYIWEKYNGEIPKGMEIHHINKDRSDYSLNNLELVDKKLHHREHAKEHFLGVTNKGKPKLYQSGCVPIRKAVFLIKDGEKKYFESVSSAAKYIGTKPSKLCKVLKKERKTVHKYKAEYANVREDL